MQRLGAVVTHMKEHSNITYLAGEIKKPIKPFVPYEEILCEFLDKLSNELRSSKEATAFPDIMAFALFCRKQNINKLKAEFEDGRIRLGRGLVFHITPSNVPINFAFSFVFGLISGNANIVRVPSNLFPQIDIVSNIIDRLLNSQSFNEIKKMTSFVRYEHNDSITSGYSKECDARIIWGGDSTINNIRKFPVPERSIDIAFSDRYSICVINAPSVCEINDGELKRLAERFYNDTYLMDQNACSSPHLIIWLGKDKKAAKDRFWGAIHNIVKEKYHLATVNAVDKFTLLCQHSIELNNIRKFTKHCNYIYRLDIDKLPSNIEEIRGKCGYFFEFDSDDISNIVPIINNKYQTLTYFGIDKEELIGFIIKNRLSGIDRVVPIGRALDIGTFWDGYDVIKTLSRIIDS